MSIAGTAIALILLLGATAPALAQGGAGGYEPGSSQGPGGGGRMRHGGGGHQQQMISREALEGPPAPALLRDSIGLSGDQFQHYSRLYSNYTAETGAARDSLRTSMLAMRGAFESGDRSAGRSRHDTIEQQSQDLTKRDKEFEKVVKEGLTKDQRKRYDNWKKSRDKAERDNSQRMRPSGSAGNL
jgi:hypothetical protein